MYRTNTLLANIRRVMKLYDTMLKPVCEHYDLLLVEATIISFLFNNPGRDTAADIVELRMLSKSNVSQAVESLIRKGLLMRNQDSRDRRKIHLSLTLKAKPVTDEIEQIRKEYQSIIFRGFSEEEIKQFTRFYERIAENAKADAKGGETA